MPAAVDLVSDTHESIDHQNKAGALRIYSERFKHVESTGLCLFARQAFPWRSDGDKAEQQWASNKEVVRAEIEKDLGLKLGVQQDNGNDKTAQASVLRKDVNGRRTKGSKKSVPHCAVPLTKRSSVATPAKVEDSDAEEERVLPCGRCGLPVGDVSYGDMRMDLRSRPMHGECMAQCMLADKRKDDHERRRQEAELKHSRRKEFNIGWQTGSIPSNTGPAEKMGCHFVPQGMCSLVLQEAACTVHVVPTLEPAGAVNLAYLSIALQVRRQDGREPLFSLDPVDPRNEDSMQVKRFEPKWLACTCVGDVLFQADYYLKELSMGEHRQPVVGMRSCFDYSWEEGHDTHWRAREWFMVRKAEVHISEDNVLIPFVRMGVEAWEQLVAPDGELKDAKVTRRDHPLLRYAEAFTHNFDLIAERKSVIYHLRELARASVLAKYLVDSRMPVPEAWFLAAGVTAATDPEPKSLEIPQLWNERAYSKIRLEDGKIVDYAGSFDTQRHGVYGGVSFGLDRFKVAAHGRAPGSTLQAVSPGLIRQGRPSLMPQREAPRPAWTAPMAPISRADPRDVRRADPRGVDLNLDNFDLSRAKRVASHVTALQVGEDACAAIGNDFWLNVESCHESAFKDDDRLLLARLFNPRMTDRRGEGDKFVPPDTSNTYLERLSNLLKEEDSIRLQRQRHFYSKQFQAADPGPLFPSCWKNYIEIDRKSSGFQQEGMLHERPDYTAEAQMFDSVLHSATPVFDKSTEEGLRFRVYKIGRLEVRTVQEVHEKELVGAVFSKSQSNQSRTQCAPLEKTKVTDKIMKVTMYVEKIRRKRSSVHYYVVVETEKADLLVAEMHPDGAMTWNENPVDLDVRNSLAKVFRSADCRGTAVTIHQVKSRRGQPIDSEEALFARSTGKRFAQGIYDWCRGETQRAARSRAMEKCKVPSAPPGVARSRAREGSVWEGLALQARNQRQEQ